MDRLAEQVVDWHNRHPLAKRITIYDVHTIGVVALPFMRSGGMALGAGQVEPVLNSEVAPGDQQSADWHEGTTVAAELHPNAAQLDALADQEAPLFARRKPLDTLRALLPLLLLRRRSKALWPVFSDRFIENLSIKQVASFADEHGYATRPGDTSWPLRTVDVDDALAAAGFAGAGGAWPCELYLKSAAIDAGTSRSRVLIGRGGLRPPVLGRRCMDPKRLGAAALVALVLIGLPVWLLWPHSEPAAGHAPAAASAAVPASAPAVHAVTGLAAPASSAASTASMPEGAASSAASAGTAGAAAAASMPASAPMAAASEPPPDIRPQILPLQGGRTRGGKPITGAPPIGGAASAAEAAAAKPEDTPVKPGTATLATASPGTAAAPPLVPKQSVIVALVGPPSRDKEAAEKLLALMLELAQPTLPSPALVASMPVPSSVLPLQSQVFLTPEGWRPALYPFGSREQAQLVNANLVAHGLRTKAVNF